MKKEEAIKRFQRMKKVLSIPNSNAERTIEAIDMAIEALSAEPTDLISRADAIEAVRKKLQDWGGYAFEEHREGLYEAIDVLESLPSADRPSGEWVIVNKGLDIYICDQCGEVEQIQRIPIWGYCPNCGAKMKGESDECK